MSDGIPLWFFFLKSQKDRTGFEPELNTNLSGDRLGSESDSMQDNCRGKTAGFEQSCL